MPKFLYTIVVASIASWIGFYSYLTSTSPDTFTDILIFLGILLFALVMTLSLPIYYILHKQAPTFSNLRFLYRKSLKWSLFFSFGLVFLMGLRAYGLDNLVNVTLFVIFYFLLYIQIFNKR